MSSRLSATFTLSRCQNRLSAEGRYFGGEYRDDPINLVCYKWHRLQAAFPIIWDVPSRISFVSYQSPSASHPSSCSSLAHVRGWFMTDPFSKGPLHLFALRGAHSAWGVPSLSPLGESCHLPSTHISEIAPCLLPNPWSDGADPLEGHRIKS